MVTVHDHRSVAIVSGLLLAKPPGLRKVAGMKKTLAGTAALLLLGAAACNVSTPSFSFKYAERRGRLDSNGLRFVIMPDSTTQLVQVDVRYEVGEKEDPIGKAGIAHLVEHLMFQQRPPAADGTETPPLFQQISDKTIIFNAYTNWDTTHYMNTGMSNQVEQLLALEAQRMYLRCLTVPESEFLREREVVRNEIRQRTGSAKGQIEQQILSSVYPKGHAYEQMVGGDDMQLASTTLKDVCAFMDQYYRPENATVIVAGGVDIQSTITHISTLFGQIPKSPVGPKKAAERVRINPIKTVVELDIEHPTVAVTWALPPANTPEGEAVQYGLNQVFFRTAYKAQQYEFANKVTPEILGGQLAPIFSVLIELKSMSNYDEAIEFVKKAAKSAYRGFDDASKAQIEENQNITKAEIIGSLEPLEARTNIIGNEVQFNTRIGFDSADLYLFKLLDKSNKYDGEFIGDAIKKAIDPNKMRIVVFKPNKEGIKGDKRSNVTFEKSEETREPTDVDPNEARRPVKLQKDVKGLGAAQQFTLANGMKVMLFPIKAMPLVAATLLFRNTGRASTPQEPAVAGAAAQFLSLPLDAEAFQRTGISVGCGANSDTTYCSTHGINIYLDLMINGLERIIVAGEYNQKQLEQYQKNFKNTFDRERAENSEYSRQLLSALYGADHPYAKTGILTPDLVSKLSQDRLDSFRRSNYVAANATLVVAGDFDAAIAEKKIRGIFGNWSKGTASKPVSNQLYQRSGPSFIGVIAKEEPQLRVTIAYPAPAGIDGQSGARDVLAQMLTIRMGDVRTKLGTTYGVYANVATHIGPSAYQMGGTVDAPTAGASIKMMRDGVEMLRHNESFSNQEFVRARRKVLSQLLGLSTVTEELAGALAEIAAFSLEPSQYNTNLQQVAAASPILVKSIVAAELNPNNEVVVIKGTREQLEKAFRDAGINDVKYVEAASIK